MSIIPEQEMYTEIRNTGFSCQRCGACCRETEPGSNIVMVSPVEVRAIMAGTGLTFDEIAVPYPDTIREGDREYTLAWAIRREDGRCIFFIHNACSVYEIRPWICRTYPFMLDNGCLTVSPCNGVETDPTHPAEQPHVHQIVRDLLERQKAETEEEERVAEVLTRVTIPAGQFVVIDGEGMRTING